MSEQDSAGINQYISYNHSLPDFPKLMGVVIQARRYGYYTWENWGTIRAHAHHDAGVICVPDDEDACGMRKVE